MRTIIITGGELFNKGAQAMTFLTVSEMKRRFPDHEIYVLSEMDRGRPREELDNYRFRVFGWTPLKFARAQQNLPLKISCLLRNREEYKKAEEIYKNADLMLDISGYALGSNWGSKINSQYLDHLEYAKRFGIPLWILPQSFGPFDYEGEEGKRLMERMESLLPYAGRIYTREKKGYEDLRQCFGLNNVEMAPDIVLCGGDLKAEEIYYKVPTLFEMDIPENAAAVIPNKNLTNLMPEEELIELFGALIGKFKEKNFSVYLIRHSSDDQKLCSAIYERLASRGEDGDVFYVDRDLNCLEFSSLIGKFSFACASRYHAIVHAYRKKVPCLAIGWADKYLELMTLFEQDRYAMDLRKIKDKEAVLDKAEEFMRRLPGNRDCIGSYFAAAGSTNIFDEISLRR